MIVTRGYNKEALKEILAKPECCTLTDTGRVLPPSHAVFETILKLMLEKGSQIRPKHVHTIINSNRNGFKSFVLKTLKITESELHSSIDDRDFSINVSRSVEEPSSDACTESITIEINLVISAEKWHGIRPEGKNYGCRIYWKMRPGWADVIAESIWVQHQIDCIISFKNNSVYRCATARQYLSFYGVCVECNAKITGSLLKEPAKDVDVVVICRIEGMNSQKHSKKKRRHLSGDRRRKIADAMIDGRRDAVVVRRQEAGRLKRFGGKYPPVLPSTAVLRKAKEEGLSKKYGLKFSNPSLNLLDSSQNGKYVGCIHFIGLLKFNCIYWTPEQAQIYTARCRKDPNATLALDATGGVVKREKAHDPHVFLYQCVLITSEGSVPTFQMVTADHRALNISYFLRLILAANLPIPPIVVTDFGWALLIAVAEIFGRCSSFGEYLQRCFDAASHKLITLPSTYMRLDVSHHIAMVSRWTCLRGKEKILVRRFYLRCVGQMCQISTLDELSYFAESVLSVALSQYVGYSPSNDILPSEERLRFLNTKIKGAVLTSLTRSEDNELDDADEDFHEGNIEKEENPEEAQVSTSSWKTWSDDLYKAGEGIAAASLNGDSINACYNENFAQKFKGYLLPYVALWTSVMQPIFGKGSATATSAAVESEFCDVKNRQFADELPIRVDKFVPKHLDKIDEKIKLASKESDILPDTSKSQSESLPETTSEISFSFHDQKACSTPNRSIEENAVSKNASEPSILSGTVSSITTDKKVVEARFDNSEQSSLKETTFVAEESSGGSRLVDKTSCDETSNVTDVYVPADNEWIVKETWGGLNKNAKSIDSDGAPKPKRLKPSYLDNCPEWDFIKDSKVGRIPVLRNGHISPPVNMGAYKLNIRNSCAFDSILQVLISGALNNRLYREKTISSTCPTMKLAYAVINDKTVTAKHYKLRAEVLSKVGVFEISSYARKIKTLDAKCNAADLAERVLHSEPSFSYRIECCCGYTNGKSYALLNVNVDIILSCGMDRIQEAIDDNLNVGRSCFSCKRSVESHATYGSHLIIDTSVLTYDEYVNKSTIVHTLGSITKSVMIGQKSYMLMGVVDYKRASEHYIAYAPAGVYWYRYDDLLQTRKSVNSTTKITPHIIMYATCTEENSSL